MVNTRAKESWRLVEVNRVHHELAFELQAWRNSKACRFPR